MNNKENEELFAKIQRLEVNEEKGNEFFTYINHTFPFQLVSRALTQYRYLKNEGIDPYTTEIRSLKPEQMKSFQALSSFKMSLAFYVELFGLYGDQNKKRVGALQNLANDLMNCIRHTPDSIDGLSSKCTGIIEMVDDLGTGQTEKVSGLIKGILPRYSETILQFEDELIEQGGPCSDLLKQSVMKTLKTGDVDDELYGAYEICKMSQTQEWDNVKDCMSKGNPKNCVRSVESLYSRYFSMQDIEMKAIETKITN